jgi:hypothetical protein
MITKSGEISFRGEDSDMTKVSLGEVVYAVETDGINENFRKYWIVSVDRKSSSMIRECKGFTFEKGTYAVRAKIKIN